MDLQTLQEIFPPEQGEASLNRGQAVLKVKLADIHAVLQRCKEDPRLKFNFLMDVIGVDYLGQAPRFELVYILYSLELKHRLRVTVRLDEGQAVPTASDLYRSADWAEREVYDMFGIKFTKHPNLKRILLFEGFQGHPLRKDYPVNQRQQIPEIEATLKGN